jgi:hypothetical protein
MSLELKLLIQLEFLLGGALAVVKFAHARLLEARSGITS